MTPKTDCAPPCPTVPGHSGVDRAPCLVKARSNALAHTPNLDRAPGHSQWLEERITTSRRQARPQPCPRCDAATLVGPDHDTVAYVARVDAQPVDRLHEAAGRLTGRWSFDLIRGALYRRDLEHITATVHPHPIHLEHRCVKETLW